MESDSLGRSLLLITLLTASALAADERPAVTVWLVPSEQTPPGEITQGDKIQASVDRFNVKYADTPVTVLNTTDPVLKMKLLSWNPAFVVPNAAVVMSQVKTLDALVGFARKQGIRINVRFVTWDEAFGLIRDLDFANRSAAFPDVVQIGSTWNGYMASHGLTMSRPNWEHDRKKWTDVLGVPASSLSYITDVRLLFYWRRLPGLARQNELVLNTSSWKSLIESLRERAGTSDTLVFPTGLTLNILHDYAPLVWAGGGSLFIPTSAKGNRIDLTSHEALAVPRQLLRDAMEYSTPGNPKRRLITFQESSHEEVDRIFVNGGYRVVQEPANFIARWQYDFEQRHKNDGLRFWDYAGVAVPPVSFKGGSNLIVTKNAPLPEMAFGLADFLATHQVTIKILAEAGHLPAGQEGNGIRVLAARVSRLEKSRLTEVDKLQDAIDTAIRQGRSYPDLPDWPILMENSRAQEAFQTIWRRMSEGDADRMEAAAQAAEESINRQLYWWSELRDGIYAARWAIVAIALAVLGIVGMLLRRAGKSRRSLVLLVFLYRAQRHEAAKYLGDNFLSLAANAKEKNLTAEELFNQVFNLATFFKDHLAPHIDSLAQRQYEQFSAKTTAPQRLDEIVQFALNGARYIYQAKEMVAPAEILFLPDGLSGITVKRYPVALTVALEEWFFNSIRYMASKELSNPSIQCALHGQDLVIETTGTLEEPHAAALNAKPRHGDITFREQGLKLIRNIIYYAYNKRVKVENRTSEHGVPFVRLTIPLGKAVQKP